MNEDIAARYLAGESADMIAMDYDNLSSRAVGKRLEKMGVQMRSRSEATTLHYQRVAAQREEARRQAEECVCRNPVVGPSYFGRRLCGRCGLAVHRTGDAA